MTQWAQVRWTEARQLVALQGAEPAALPDEGVTPHAHYTMLREAGRRDEAVAFLAIALPRFEAIGWAARIVEEEANARRLSGPDRQALDYALRWLGEPNDDRRRAAMDAAGIAGERAPERLLALAVFFSGGSVSTPDLPAILPPPEAAAKCAGGAVAIAAHLTQDAPAVLDRALDLGEMVADQGMQALANP